MIPDIGNVNVNSNIIPTVGVGVVVGGVDPGLSYNSYGGHCDQCTVPSASLHRHYSPQ